MIKRNKRKEIKVKFTNPTPGDQLGITADIQLLKNDFEFDGLINFDNGLNKMLNWSLDQIN